MRSPPRRRKWACRRARRLEISAYADLADRLSYTQEDVREIVAFAAARGITVVPEIEMPGHSAAILEVMPELRCDPSAGGSANVYCAGNDRVFGAQGNLWCDRIGSFETAGYQLFPRALALAEVAWSPRSKRDYRALTERIVTHLPRLAALQVNARYPDGIDFRYQDRMLTLDPEQHGARVHFTLNGTAPSVTDPVYAEPVPLPRPTLVRATIVRPDGTLGRCKSFMACDLLDRRRLTVIAATDSDPSHPAPAVLDGTNWSFWLTAAERPRFPHEIAFDLGAEEEIAGFIYEPRTDGPLDGNVLAYELHVSAGPGSVMAASGSFNGRRQAQPVILDRPTRARTVTLRILDATPTMSR